MNRIAKNATITDHEEGDPQEAEHDRVRDQQEHFTTHSQRDGSFEPGFQPDGAGSLRRTCDLLDGEYAPCPSIPAFATSPAVASSPRRP